jgi:DNA topoisomerase I
MGSDDDNPSVKPKKKVKLSKTPKIKDEDNGDKLKKTGVKPAVVKSESSTAKKKRKRESEPEPVKSSTTKKKKSTATTTASGTAPKKELKKLDKSERLQYAMQSFLWWNAKEPPEGCQWVTMEHAGVSFPEPYQPHGVKLLYEGKPIDLNPVQEEA